MSVASLADILSGRGPASRADLHADLDALLDAADADGGRLDGPAYWAFVAQLAEGRGVAEDMDEGAAAAIAINGPLPDDPAAAWRSCQWAYLSALLTRISTIPGAIMPDDFAVTAWRAVAHNALSDGKMGGEYMDLMGLGTQRGTELKAIERAVRRMLVGIVYYRAERDGKFVAKVRRDILPEALTKETWRGWVREVARAKQVDPKQVGADARAAANGHADSAPYDFGSNAIAAFIRLGWHPNA